MVVMANENDTIRRSLMREGLDFLARVWKRNLAPEPFEESTYVDGVWVKVKIEYDKKRNDAAPLRRASDKQEERK
jgi:hypothetical protein